MTKQNDNRNIRVMQFLDAYEKQEILWNPTLETYKNKNARDEAYLQIIRDLNTPTLTINDIKLKVKSIRTTYTKELRMLTKSKEEGKPYSPKLFWFNRANAFLKHVSLSRDKRTLMDKYDEDYYMHDVPQRRHMRIVEDLDSSTHSIKPHEQVLENKNIQQLQQQQINQHNVLRHNPLTTSIGTSPYEDYKPAINVNLQTEIVNGDTMQHHHNDDVEDEDDDDIDTGDIGTLDVHTSQTFQNKITLTHDNLEQQYCNSAKDAISSTETIGGVNVSGGLIIPSSAASASSVAPTTTGLFVDANHAQSYTLPAVVTTVAGNINNINDEYEQFCRSVAAQLRRITDSYSRAVAKLKIQQILFEAETGHYRNNSAITIASQTLSNL